MTDPISLTLAGIATLVLTKLFEKTGEKLGEKAVEEGGKLLSLLKRKDPATVTAIERVAQQADQAEPTSVDLGVAEIVNKVEQLSQTDAEVQAAVVAVAEAAKSEPATVQNMTKLAEKIGILIQGGYNPITIEKLEV